MIEESKMEVEKKPSGLSSEIEFSLDLLRIYYDLEGAEDYFEKREFTLTLQGEIYCRFQSFRNEEKLKEALTREKLEQIPIKIDVGAIYTMVPSNTSTFKDRRNAAEKVWLLFLEVFQLTAFKIQKEFILDIDMNDYDSLRTCCTGATVCGLCWKFMTVAAKVLELTLKEDFGFSQLLWVYSGRRGMHCWVSDPDLMRNKNPIRRAIVDNLLLVQGGDKAESNVKKGILKKHMNPSVRRTLQILESAFKEIILQDQDLFQKGNLEQVILSMIDDENLKKELKKLWEETKGGSVRKWDIFLQCLNFWTSPEKHKPKLSKRIKYLKQEILLTCLYPRLDSKVSEDIGHLLKSPFCIHPSTGKACVPIIDHKTFNPEKVPRLVKLIAGGSDKEKFDEYVQFFTDYVNKCVKESKIYAKKFGKNSEALAF